MIRITKQRSAILKCLMEKGRPLSTEEILCYAKEEIPQLNLSTVYRTLKSLIQEQKITTTELPGERTCYEIIQPSHHHYFLCGSCNKVYFINQCPKGLSDIVPKDFQLLSHSITLKGFCSTCNL